MPDHTAASDSELLSAWLKRGDEPAFHTLVERYAVLVHQAARRLCGDDALAADASQATFIALVRKARSLEGRLSLAGWLHVTAVLQARNLLRQRQRENRKHELLRSHMDLASQEPSAAWTRLQPHLDDALASLSEADRETLLLRFYRSLSVGEIARSLGIATAAAQKRLDRATERLRRQLDRRGCSAGPDLGAIMLAGFAADSHLLLPATPSLLAGKALAVAGTAGLTSTTTLGLILMTKKTATIAGAALLLAGAGVLIATHKNDGDAAAQTSNAATGPGSSAPAAGTHTAAADDAALKLKARKDREAQRDAELISKYGESRTNLSRKIAGDVVGLMEDAISMGEMVTSGPAAGAFGGPEGRVRRGLGGIYNKLELTDEQKTKVNTAYDEFQKRQIAKAKTDVEDLKKNPDSMMNLFLAGDAYKRGEMTEADYKVFQQEHAEELKKIVNPLDEKNLRGRPLRDPAFTAQMNGILEPSQNETFQAAVTEDSQKAAGKDMDISNLPVMDLEKLDTTITGARKFTAGMKQMVEGSGSLQDLGPMMEERRKQRQDGQGQ